MSSKKRKRAIGGTFPVEESERERQDQPGRHQHLGCCWSSFLRRARAVLSATGAATGGLLLTVAPAARLLYTLDICVVTGERVGETSGGSSIWAAAAAAAASKQSQEKNICQIPMAGPLVRFLQSSVHTCAKKPKYFCCVLLYKDKKLSPRPLKYIESMIDLNLLDCSTRRVRRGGEICH